MSDKMKIGCDFSRSRDETVRTIFITKEDTARIEELEAERDKLFRKAALADEWCDSDRQRAIDAEAKLAKAVEALEAFSEYDRAAFFGPDAAKNKRAVYRGVKRKILKAIAAIKGEAE